MHVYNYNGTKWEGDNKGRERKQTRTYARNVVQVFDLKTTSSEKLAIMEFPENVLCLQNGPEKPQSKCLKTSYEMLKMMIKAIEGEG